MEHVVGARGRLTWSVHVVANEKVAQSETDGGASRQLLSSVHAVILARWASLRWS
jgi:hypothetical protein